MAEDQRVDLGLVDSIQAETIGKPGQRTFNITARSSRGQAIVWMEKDQLLQLALAIGQLSEDQKPSDPPAAFVPEYAHTGEPVNVEFKVGDMRVRYDTSTDVFTMEATDPGARDEDDGPEETQAERQAEEQVSVQFSFSRSGARVLAEDGQRIVAAGRPRCPYCHSPIEPDGHMCPRSNGHSRTGIPVE